MQTKLLFAVAAGGLLFVAACARQAERPVQAEPIYDKYGNAVYSGCVPAGQRTGRQSNLPTCETSTSCGRGEQAGTDANGGQICVPIPQRRERDPEEPTGNGQA